MAEQGWIKTYRKMRNWQWYKDSLTKAVFLELLIMANYEDEDCYGFTVKRGQYLTSLPELAKSLGMGVQNVRTALNHLKQTGEITEEASNRGRLITICKYAAYQEGVWEEKAQPKTDLESSQQANQQAKMPVANRLKPQRNPSKMPVANRQNDEELTGKLTGSYIEEEDKESRYIYIPPIIPPQDPKKPDPIHEEIFAWLGAIPPLAVDDITDFRASPGIDDELIREAIKSTKARGIRQWSYAASILRDAIARGILTGQAFRAAKEVRTNGRRDEADEIHTRSPGRKQRSGAFIEKPGVDWDAIMPEA